MQYHTVVPYALALFLSACTANLPPSTRTLQMPTARKSDAELVQAISKALAQAGYEIKSKDEGAGVIQAFRPSKGLFGDPNYGHRVTISVEHGAVKITAFAMEGQLGAESPETISGEVERIIQGS